MARESFNNPNSPVQPGFMSGTARQYLGMRNFAQNNRAKALEQQTAQMNMRKAVFEQATSEMEFMQKQQDRLRSDKVRMANASLYNDLSNEWVNVMSNPGAYSQAQLGEMVGQWERLLDSEAFNSEAQAKIGRLTSMGVGKQQKQIFDNGLEFNNMSANGKAFDNKTFTSLDKEFVQRFNWGKKQVGQPTVNQQTGEVIDDGYAWFQDGLSKGYKAEQRIKLEKFAGSALLPEGQGLTYAELLNDKDVQLARELDPDFAKLYDESIETVATEERADVRKVEAEERKEEREADKPAKVSRKFGFEMPSGHMDTFIVSGTPEKIQKAKEELDKIMGVDDTTKEDDPSKESSLGPSIPSKYLR